MESSVPSPVAPESEAAVEARIEDIRAQLRTLERRDWWLWSGAIIVMLLLTGAVASLSFPVLLNVRDPFFQFSLSQSVRGLVGLVLLFNTYSIYQQVTIKRLRRSFNQQLDAMRHLHLRAEEFHRLATTDPLTGLANRRTAEVRLTAEVARSERYGHALTLVAFDLNNFKHTNDAYGHAAGDLVLCEFAKRLLHIVRVSDVAVRMGGDEFLALLPECRIEQVAGLLERLRPLSVNYRGKRIPIEFASGAVGFERGQTPAQFLERADQALYANKRAGKAAAKSRPEDQHALR